MQFHLARIRLHGLYQSSVITLLLASCLILPATINGQDVTPAATTQQQAPPPPAGCTQDCDKWVPLKKNIDFSAQHKVLLRNPDGTLQPMDEPYFKPTQIAPGTWQILSDGDYAYVVEGDNEALVIDSTYGAGNIREFAQTLTKKPVRSVVNTHDHFDHTANNAYFDRAYMSAYAKTKATVPFPSFAGITFPRDYPITTIGEGYVFHLGNRDLEVFEVPNHTMGDLAFLDRKERILFSGDTFSQASMPINKESSVARFAANMGKLAAHRKEFDRLAGGFRLEDASTVDKCLASAEYILAGHEGDPLGQQPSGPPPGMPSFGGTPAQQVPAPPGAVVFTRHIPHAGDGNQGRRGALNPDMRRLTYGGCTITYDINRIK